MSCCRGSGVQRQMRDFLRAVRLLLLDLASTVLFVVLFLVTHNTILSVSLGKRRVRQIPIPREMKKEVSQSLLAFAQAQKLLKQIAGVNLEALKERKRRR